MTPLEVTVKTLREHVADGAWFEGWTCKSEGCDWAFPIRGSIPDAIASFAQHQNRATCRAGRPRHPTLGTRTQAGRDRTQRARNRGRRLPRRDRRHPDQPRRRAGHDPWDRIAQLVIVPILTPAVQIVDSLDDTERGAGGFGSTGHA